MNEQRAKLYRKLDNKDYRDAFVAEQIRVGLAFQIREMRSELHQEEFGALTSPHFAQKQISDFENPAKPFPSLPSLLRLASALDVGLVCHFAPYKEIVDRTLKLSTAQLTPTPYEREREEPETEPELVATTSTRLPISPYPLATAQGQMIWTTLAPSGTEAKIVLFPDRPTDTPQTELQGVASGY